MRMRLSVPAVAIARPELDRGRPVALTRGCNVPRPIRGQRLPATEVMPTLGVGHRKYFVAQHPRHTYLQHRLPYATLS